jgi:hypothetical protein
MTARVVDLASERMARENGGWDVHEQRCSACGHYCVVVAPAGLGWPRQCPRCELVAGEIDTSPALHLVPRE